MSVMSVKEPSAVVMRVPVAVSAQVRAIIAQYRADVANAKAEAAKLAISAQPNEVHHVEI